MRLTQLLFPLLLVLLASLSLSSGKETHKESTSESKSDIESKKVNKREPKDWSKIKAEDIAKDWEDGDDAEELEHEHDRLQKLKQKRQPKFDANGVGNNFGKLLSENPFEFMGGGGSQMIVIILTEAQLNGQPWDKKSTDKLAKKFSGLASTSGLPCEVYNVNNNGRMLVQIHKPWFTKDVLKMLSHQPEVVKFQFQNKDYFPKDLLKEDEDDDDDDEDDDSDGDEL